MRRSLLKRCLRSRLADGGYGSVIRRRRIAQSAETIQNSSNAVDDKMSAVQAIDFMRKGETQSVAD